MFYAGRDQQLNQSIGYATAADLDTCETTWNRHDAPTWTPLSSSWMSRQATGGRQCRDPYVFQHPDSAGVYFLVYTALDSATITPSTRSLAVGVARNKTRYSLSQWLHIGHYTSTTATEDGGIGQVEGPIVFPDRGSP